MEKTQANAAGIDSEYERCLGNTDDVENYMFRKKVPLKKTDRSDRATCEHVIDNRVRLILFRLISSGKLRSIQGCINTGKEANVYVAAGADLLVKSRDKYALHASDALPAELLNKKRIDVAIKVYKTSAMSFKNRAKYIEGERRFKRFSRTNSRKLITLWAQKEMRNLRRLQRENIPSPTPLYLKNQVLVMTLIGENGMPAPLLKDALINHEMLLPLYNEALDIIENMYSKCRLVHADLSEYNLIFFSAHLYVIDVSQSVEIDHANAHVFLNNDIRNINNFFAQRGVIVMPVEEVFCRIINMKTKYLQDEMCDPENTQLNQQDNEHSADAEDSKDAADSNDLDNSEEISQAYMTNKERKKLIKEANRLRRSLRPSKKTRVQEELRRERERLDRVRMILRKKKTKKNKCDRPIYGKE